MTKLWSPAFYDAVNPKTVTVGTHKPAPDWISPPLQVQQTDFNLWYIQKGEGSAEVDDQWIRFEPGDLVTLPPGTRLSREHAGSMPFHSTFVHLHPFGKQNHPLDPALAQAWPRKISLLHRPEVAELFTRYFEAHTTRQKKNSLAVRGIALELLDTLFDELQKKPTDQKPRATRNLLYAKDLIESRFADPLTLDEIARHSELSQSHLSALFKRHMGTSPIDYLLHVRIRKAKLLLASGARVKEAAAATGFDSQHYFSRQFKKKTGMTPTQFAGKHVYTFQTKPTE